MSTTSPVHVADNDTSLSLTRAGVTHSTNPTRSSFASRFNMAKGLRVTWSTSDSNLVTRFSMVMGGGIKICAHGVCPEG